MSKVTLALVREIFLAAFSVAVTDCSIWYFVGHRMAVMLLKRSSLIYRYELVFPLVLLLLVVCIRRLPLARATLAGSFLFGGMVGYAASFIALIWAQLLVAPETLSPVKLGAGESFAILLLNLMGAFVLLGWCCGLLAASLTFLLDRALVGRKAMLP